MKKIITIIILLITVGCNSTEFNNLKCEKTEENKTTKINLDYLNNGKELQKINIVTTITIEEDLINLINQEEACINYQNHQGIICKSEIINNQYVITLDYDIKNMTSENISEFDLENDQNLTTKENLEKENYSCK